MTDVPTTDRRRHQRYPLSTGVQVYHEPSRGELPARAVDISDGGMLMVMPVSAPVKAGQPVRLRIRRMPALDRFGQGPAGPLGALGNMPLKARIVRVQRRGLLTTGRLAVGVEFAGA